MPICKNCSETLPAVHMGGAAGLGKSVARLDLRALNLVSVCFLCSFFCLHELHAEPCLVIGVSVLYLYEDWSPLDDTGALAADAPARDVLFFDPPRRRLLAFQFFVSSWLGNPIAEDLVDLPSQLWCSPPSIVSNYLLGS